MMYSESYHTSTSRVTLSSQVYTHTALTVPQPLVLSLRFLFHRASIACSKQTHVVIYLLRNSHSRRHVGIPLAGHRGKHLLDLHHPLGELIVGDLADVVLEMLLGVGVHIHVFTRLALLTDHGARLEASLDGRRK